MEEHNHVIGNNGANTDLKKTQLKIQAALAKEREGRKNDLLKTKARIDVLRLKLTKERNHEQYLRRCIRALDTRLGDIKEGQLEFKI